MDRETLKGLVDPNLHEWMDNIHEMCNTPYAVENGIELVRLSKEPVMSVIMKKEILPRDLNSNGVVHGATSFGIIDHAFAIVGNTDVRTVGLSCTVNYYRPCFGGVMIAEAKEVNRSRTLLTADVQLRCEGKLIASALCIGFIGEKPRR
jgi:acyl-CoA thioesterase